MGRCEAVPGRAANQSFPSGTARKTGPLRRGRTKAQVAGAQKGLAPVDVGASGKHILCFHVPAGNLWSASLLEGDASRAVFYVRTRACRKERQRKPLLPASTANPATQHATASINR